ncbi:MAG: L,D-transpeptidase [Muribaculaceae bacterium]|nr:L,D-transpeptidase [Muribaculaceae bacterium]
MKKILPIILLMIAAVAGARETGDIPAGRYIVISKADYTLTLYEADGTPIFSTVCSVGRNMGDKERVGDCRTPEGTFEIGSIEDASQWRHNIRDGRGAVRGVYGPFFMRLRVPGNNTIGIHGTLFNETMGSRASLGCIRLQDEEVLKLRSMIHIGTKVTVLPEGVSNPDALPVVVPQLASPHHPTNPRVAVEE